MSIIKNILIGNPFDLAKDLETLREKAYRECLAEAERMNLHVSAASFNLDEYSEFVPEPIEIATWLTEEQMGDWQEVLRVTAVLTTRFALEAEVDADLRIIERAIHEASLSGFDALTLYSTNAHGGLPHACEIDWKTGTLHLYRFRDGTIDAGILQVELSDVSEIWLDLDPID